MQPGTKKHGQEGLSILELMIGVAVMLIVLGTVMALVKSSITNSAATYEMTDAQENLRFAQEFINRDLMNAGDGLKAISTIRAPSGFMTNYITLNPVVDAADSMPTGIINFGILTSDNQIPVGTTVTGAPSGTTVLVNPGADNTLNTADDVKTDRHTVLQIDSTFIPISPSSINAAGTLVTLPSGTNMSLFTVGEIYFINSSLGATFATVTGKNDGARQLNLNSSDTYGLNLSGNSNNVKVISSNGSLPTSLQRMQMVHYYITNKKLLMRRVFGVKGAGFKEAVIAEHITNVQFKYSLETVDASGNIVQPTNTLSTKAQRLGVRQVEVTVTAETPHMLSTGTTQLSMTTGTSVRNMQFRQAKQPS
jgi:Tfp pilus assembly protein PilE